MFLFFTGYTSFEIAQIFIIIFLLNVIVTSDFLYVVGVSHHW